MSDVGLNKHDSAVLTCGRATDEHVESDAQDLLDGFDGKSWDCKWKIKLPHRKLIWK